MHSWWNPKCKWVFSSHHLVYLPKRGFCWQNAPWNCCCICSFTVQWWYASKDIISWLAWHYWRTLYRTVFIAKWQKKDQALINRNRDWESNKAQKARKSFHRPTQQGLSTWYLCRWWLKMIYYNFFISMMAMINTFLFFFSNIYVSPLKMTSKSLFFSKHDFFLLLCCIKFETTQKVQNLEPCNLANLNYR